MLTFNKAGALFAQALEALPWAPQGRDCRGQDTGGAGAGAGGGGRGGDARRCDKVSAIWRTWDDGHVWEVAGKEGRERWLCGREMVDLLMYVAD